MTDMELLEIAAKAVGIQLLWRRGFPYRGCNGVRQAEWNPLDDDGDALRLAVDLGLKIEITESTVLVEPHKMPSATQLELIGIEPNAATRRAATRRAIVRAAAAIGKDMLERDGRNRDGSR